MKKYIVLPFDEYTRKNNKECTDNNNDKYTINETENDSNNTLRNLDMIIRDKNRNDSEKRIIYSQLLDKLISFVNEERKNNASYKNTMFTHNFKPEEKIKSFFQNRLIRKGLLLLDAIERTREVSWDDKGETTIMGNTIKGSNIIDLINFTVRNIKKPYPIGLETYKIWLLNSGIPSDLITNTTLKNVTSPLTPTDDAPVIATQKSTKRKSRRIQNKKKDQLRNLQDKLEEELDEESNLTPIRSKFSPWTEY